MDIPHLECCAREPVEKFRGGIEFEGEIEKRIAVWRRSLENLKWILCGR